MGPRPRQRLQERTVHGDTVVTRYGWLRDRHSSEVAAHLDAENAYTDRATADLGALRSRLAQDLTSPGPDPDLSVPVYSDGWWYIDRAGDQGDRGAHPSLSRVQDRAVLRGERGPGGVPEVPAGHLLEGEQTLIPDRRGVLDVAFSAGGGLLARAEASIGGCSVTIVDLSTSDELDRSVRTAGPDLVFSADSQWLLYTRLDEFGRSHQVRRHRIGSSAGEDVTVLEEPDHWAELQLARSRDGSTLVIRSVSVAATETWLLDLDDPTSAPRSVTGRHHGAHPVIEHAGDRLLVILQDDAGHSVLAEAPLRSVDVASQARPVLTARRGEQFDDVEAFAGFLALQVRAEGLPGVRIIPRRDDGSVEILAARALGHGGELDAVRLDANPSWSQRTVRYRLDSLLTPATIAQVDVATSEITVLRRAAAPAVDPERYLERRLWAPGPQGALIPISLISRRDVVADGTAPGLLFGEGAFGTSVDPMLVPGTLELADRGLVVAIAHVRGGGEMGPSWHLSGRQLHKATSFDDFAACADHLLSTGWVAPGRLGAAGTGAGGLLVAASANRSPGLFRAIIVGAPLVDPLETLLDPEVMLTLEEWAEWGDPAGDEAIYRCLRGYSPAENVREAEYPAVFAWTALDGTDIPHAEAAIWIAELRETVTSDQAERPILLRCVPEVHGDALELQAEAMAWLLDQLDVPGASS
nr:prolyl oligopeptidase family serine peptidase [Brachybacterium sp. FME24]